MTMKKYLAIPMSAALMFGLAACSSDGSSGGGDNYIIVNSSEPQNPLVPANTTENGGGRPIDMLYSGLVYYDAKGEEHNEVAEKIETEDSQKYTITLRKDAKFSDGSPVKAENFVKAWNYAVENSLQAASFFEPIKGYAEGVKEMEGLKVVDDYTFTVELTQPEADFPLRLGYAVFYPMHDSAFDDIEAYGQKPIGNGPYVLEEWNHDASALLVKNPEYVGPREAKNDGIDFRFYAKIDAAYTDLLAGNLDVIDAIPDSAFKTYESELNGRAVNQPAAVFQSFTVPERLDHFSGEEGNLRRQALSMAFDRSEITEKIFDGTRTPAKDFTSPVIAGYDKDLKGHDVLQYNPEKAKELWEKADAISPWSGSFEIAYNADGGHQGWVDAVTNSIRNTLGIDAQGKPMPDFKSFRNEVKDRTIQTGFRTGWQADYPGLGNFLVPLYTTGASSNDGDYSSAAFDAQMKKAAGADSVEESSKLYNEGQEILFQDLPAIPLWYSNVNGGWSENVDNVVFNWKSVPEYYSITKK